VQSIIELFPKKNIAIAILVSIFSAAVSCVSDTKPSSVKPSVIQPINPNGDSELALLMRAMYDDAALIKEHIAEGKTPPFGVDHDAILTAHATEPEKAASDEYKAFARIYLETIKQLETAETHEMDQLYDTMVQQCMSCHRALCPGPIVKIKKLL